MIKVADVKRKKKTVGLLQNMKIHTGLALRGPCTLFRPTICQKFIEVLGQVMI